MFPRNAASPERIAVGAVVQISDGAVQTTGVSIKVKPQGAAASAGGGTTTYEEGIVGYVPTQAETDYTSFQVIAYKTGCIPSAVTIVTSASATAGKVVLSGETHTSAVIPTVTTLTGHTAQTGDAFARLGAPAGASVSADVAAVKVDTAAVKVKTDFLPSATAGAAGGVFIAGSNAATSVTTAFTANITGNLSGSVGSVTGAVGSVTGAVGSVTARVTANTDQLAGQTVTAAAGVTFPTSIASPTNITAGTITTVTNLTNAATAGDFTATMKTSIGTAVAASAVASVTGNVGGNVTGSVGSVTGLTNTTIADAVWDEAISGHLTGGTTGAALNAAGSAGDPWSTPLPGAYGAGTAGFIIADILGVTDKLDTTLTPATGSPGEYQFTADALELAPVGAGGGSAPSASAVAAAVWAEALPGGYSAGQAGKIVGDNINATVSSRATQTSVDTVDTVVDAILVDTAEIGAAGAGLTALATAANLATLTAYVDTEVAAILAAVDTEVAAIKAKTDNLPAAPAATGDIPTALQNADALLNRDMSAVSDTNARSPLNAFRFIRNKWSIAGSTLTVTKEDDTTSAWTSAVATTAGADPVTGNDPA